ncbi:beta-lactamase family protein [Puniceicoccaceae bacterium K14]|nr:beta-lactamase family protein [Puniceicoccaceae bacterium K14]
MAALPIFTFSRERVVFPDGSWQRATPESQGFDSRKVENALAYLKSVVGDEGVSQTLLVSRGYVIWSGNDIDRIHPVWSCTKSFLSTCLGLLWDDGKCSPSDLAAIYLPELAEKYPKVTLEHLATFTSGLDLQRGEIEADDPDFEVGTAMHYSVQSDLLALILTKIANEPLKTLFKRRIGDPIGIPDDAFYWGTIHELNSIELNGGAGMPENGISTNARAIARFGWLFANGGEWRGRQLISKRYIDYACSVRVPATVKPFNSEEWYADVLPGNYGLNWWVNGEGKNGKLLWPTLSSRAFAAQGNKNNICIIEPERKLVLVRLAEDSVIDVSLYDGVFARLLDR